MEIQINIDDYILKTFIFIFGLMLIGIFGVMFGSSERLSLILFGQGFLVIPFFFVTECTKIKFAKNQK